MISAFTLTLRLSYVSYIMHRELHEKNMLVEDWESPVPSPPYYELEVLDEAVRFIFLKD